MIVRPRITKLNSRKVGNIARMCQLRIFKVHLKNYFIIVLLVFICCEVGKDRCKCELKCQASCSARNNAGDGSVLAKITGNMMAQIHTKMFVGVIKLPLG